MMKLKFAALVLLSVFLFSACEHPGYVLPTQGGKWTVSKRRTVVTVDGATDSDLTELGVGVMEFFKDGTGTTTVDSSGTIEWEWSRKFRQVKITRSPFIISHDVIESNNKTQKWFYWTEVDSWGVKVRTEVTLDLRKVNF